MVWFYAVVVLIQVVESPADQDITELKLESDQLKRVKSSPVFTQAGDHFLKRYKSLVPNWSEFLECLLEPLPTSIWINPARGNRNALKNWLEERQINARLQKWNDIGLLIDEHSNLGLGLPFILGHYHIQEEVSMLPVFCSDLKSGQNILDLCAAPGNKTVLAALLAGNESHVFANDRNSGRLQILKRAMSRLGAINISIFCGDGGRFSLPDKKFDRIFADVPCSCEGTIRKSPSLFFETEPYAGRLVSVQRHILRNAAENCTVGGKILYSTCTFAPEENEENVNWFLNRFGHNFKLEEISVPESWTTSPGLDSWNGVSFSKEVKKCMRIWPHQNNSGGFFIAKISRFSDEPL